MNPILEMLMNSTSGGAVKQVGHRFGLSVDQTSSVLNQLVPALMAGLQRNTSQEGGLDALLGALNSGNHARFLDNPEMIEQEEAANEGNSILGHIFGSKDVSRAVASRAAEKTGIGSDVLKQMLPVVATLVMGGLSRQTASGTDATFASPSGGMLNSLLDQNGDGSMADDVVGMLGRFLGQR